MHKTSVPVLTVLIILAVLISCVIGWLVVQTVQLRIDVADIQTQLAFKKEVVFTNPIAEKTLKSDQALSREQTLNKEQTQDGPFNHSVHVTRSTDPTSFPDETEPVFEAASVPDVVKLEVASEVGTVGDLLMYFPSFEEKPGPGEENIAYSRSNDNGKTWSERAFITMDDQMNAGAAVDPSLVQLEDGRLRMYFFGSEITAGDPAKLEGNHVIYSAVSEDGVHFTVEEGQRFAAEKITDPEVVRTSNQYVMYISVGTSSIITTSQDGLTFKEVGSWAGGGVPGAYLDAEDNVHVYGCGQGGLVTQESKDGITFADENFVTALQSVDPDHKIVCDPSPVLLDDGTVLLVYKKA